MKDEIAVLFSDPHASLSHYVYPQTTTDSVSAKLYFQMVSLQQSKKRNQLINSRGRRK